MPLNKELMNDLDKMSDKHARDIIRIMKRHNVDFMKLCFTMDEKGVHKMQIKSHVRNNPMPVLDPDFVYMQSMGEAKH